MPNKETEQYRPWNIECVCAKHGVDNVLFVFPMNIVHSIPFIPFIGWTNPSEKKIKVLCKIVEHNYKVADNYKIELVPQDDEMAKLFGSKKLYTMDLASIIRDGHAQILIKHDLSFPK